MATYTLHLGFDLASQPIGTFWGGTASSTQYFLQYALAGSSGQPAWFHFNAGDNLEVLLWDLSPTPTAMSVTCDLGFAPLEGSQQALSPSTLITFPSGLASVSSKDSQPYLRYTSIGTPASPPSQACPWSGNAVPYAPLSSSASNPSTAITFSAATSYKLSFYVRAAPFGGAAAKVFLSDPEVIVGSRGTGPS